MRNYLVLAILSNGKEETIARDERMCWAANQAEAVTIASKLFRLPMAEADHLLFYAATAEEQLEEQSAELQGLHASLYLMKPGEELPPEMAALAEARTKAAVAQAQGRVEEAAAMISVEDLQRLLRYAAARWRDLHEDAARATEQGNRAQTKKKGSHD
jgi:hypothetical protein